MIKIHLSKKERNIIFVNGIIFLLCFVLYLLILGKIDKYTFEERSVFALSWIGVILLIYSIQTWKNLTGKFITPYMIFLIFLICFSYGQTLLWAIGIHSDTEIGKIPLYSNYTKVNYSRIARTMLTTYVMILAVHTGAILSYIRVHKDNKKRNITNLVNKKILYKVSILVFLISYPVALWVVGKSIIQFNTNGYLSLYYGGEYYNRNTFVVTMLALFPNSLFGLLISSEKNKKIFYLVWGSFLIYAIGYTLCGNRGGWLPVLVVLVWISIQKEYLKLNFKTVNLGIICLFFGMFALEFVKNYRQNMDLIYAITEMKNADNIPFFQLLFEMGSSMSILLLVIYEGGSWSFGNSFLHAIPGAISSGLTTKIFGEDAVTPGEWLARDVVHIEWGTGFSFLGEIFLNYGKYFSILACLVAGILIGKLLLVDKQNSNQDLLKLYLVSGTLLSLISLCRNPFQSILFDWTRGTVLLMIIVITISKVLYKRGKYDG